MGDLGRQSMRRRRECEAKITHKSRLGNPLKRASCTDCYLLQTCPVDRCIADWREVYFEIDQDASPLYSSLWPNSLPQRQQRHLFRTFSEYKQTCRVRRRHLRTPSVTGPASVPWARYATIPRKWQVRDNTITLPARTYRRIVLPSNPSQKL